MYYGAPFVAGASVTKKEREAARKRAVAFFQTVSLGKIKKNASIAECFSDADHLAEAKTGSSRSSSA